MSGKDEPVSGPNRRLGRGLGALLSVPVRVPTAQSQEQKSAGPRVSSVVQDGSQSQILSGASLDLQPPEVTYGVVVPRGTGIGSGLMSIPVADISANARQPRRDFDEASIKALSESIRTAGLMQPVVVRPSTTSSGKFELIAGERRWRAAKLLGLAEIPAVVHQVGDQAAAEWALIENIQREDLNPIERSEAISRLVAEFSLTHQQLAERLGMDRVTITNLLRLEDLDPFTKDAVRKGQLTQGHAKVLLGVSQPDIRKTIATAAVSAGLSVRELERRVRDLGSASSSSKPSVGEPVTRKPHIQDLERKLSEHLGTKVFIREEPKKKGMGQVIIDYYSLQQFEGLMSKMGFVIES